MGALWPRVNVSLQAVAQVLLVIGLGVWLSARRNLDRKAIAAVSSVNWHVLIPALMFSSIVGAVTPSGLLMLWPLLMLSLLHVAMGVVPALLLCWAARLPKDMCFFAVMAASLPNCGNLPWLFMPTIIRYYTPPDQVQAEIVYSTGLTSVYTIMVVVITLTVPFLFKKPPETLMLPRSSSAASLGTQEDDDTAAAAAAAAEASAALGPAHPSRQQESPLHTQMQQQQVQPVTRSHQHLQQEQPSDFLDMQQQQEAGAAAHTGAGATAWVAPRAAGLVTSSTACKGSAPDIDITDGHPHTRDQLQTPVAQELSLWKQRQDQQQQQQQQHPGHQPFVGTLDSFSSHRSSSFLLTQSRQLFGSFSRSFSSGVNRGLRRSASFVQLVWSYPTGWQPQRRAAASGRQAGRRAGPAPLWLQRLSSLWSAFLSHPVVNLPLGATLAGIACAAVGPVRGLLVGELAALHWLWLGLAWVGAAAAPLATMQIGAELMQTAPSGDSMHVPRRVQWTANVIAIVVKLFLVPLTNIALLRLGGLAKLVPQTDKVYQLLMLVEAAVPAAVTLLVVCSRVYPDIRPLSSMLFWQYVASLFTLPAFLVWYLYMLEL